MLRLCGICFQYDGGIQGPTRVLADFTVECKSSSITVIIGPSGCGKTTLLNLMAGILTPSEGTIDRARESNGAPPQVGYVFQSPSLVPWRTVTQNALLGAELSGNHHVRASDRVQHYLGAYGLAGFEHAYPSSLSGGMQQRVAIVRALVAGAKILLLDEPFSDSDYAMRRELQRDVSRAVDEEGLTAILVTHELEEAVLMADKVIVLTARPARVTAEIVIPIPRSERFGHKWVMDPRLMPYLNQVWAALDQLENNGQQPVDREQ